MSKKNLEVLYLKDGESGWVNTTIDGELESMQALVGGYIEIVPITEKLALVVNEDWNSLQLPPTLYLNGTVVVGSVFIARRSSKGLCSVKPGDRNDIANYFRVVR